MSEHGKAAESGGVEDPELVLLIERERDPKRRIRVPAQLRNPHAVIEMARTSLGVSQPDRFGLVRSRGSLDIAVTKGSIPRALRLLNALFLALEERGHRVEVVENRGLAYSDSYPAKCILLEEQFQLQLREKTRRIRVADGHQRSKSVMPDGCEHEPLGIFELTIPDAWRISAGLWRDGAKLKLEERLNEVVIAMLTAVQPRRRKRQEAERQREATLLADQERKDHERLRQLEKTRITRLEMLSEQWSKARLLRKTIQAVRDEAIRRHGSLDKLIGLAR